MLKFFVNSIVSLVKMFGSKPSITQVVTTVMSALPSLVSQVINFKSADAKAKFDEMLQGLDDYTGSEEGAVRLFPHLPIEREEEFWDAIKTAVKIEGYQLLKVPGYWVE